MFIVSPCPGLSVKKGKCKAVPVLNYLQGLENFYESGGVAPCIVNLGTRRMSGQLHAPVALCPLPIG